MTKQNRQRNNKNKKNKKMKRHKKQATTTQLKKLSLDKNREQFSAQSESLLKK